MDGWMGGIKAVLKLRMAYSNCKYVDVILNKMASSKIAENFYFTGSQYFQNIKA